MRGATGPAGGREGCQVSEGREELLAQARELRAKIPDVWASYAGLHRAAFGEGALDAKTKELIALGVAVARQCDGCIDAHAAAAARRGASEEEVAEALGVVVVLTGGPGTVFGPRAFDSFRKAASAQAAKRQGAAPGGDK